MEVAMPSHALPIELIRFRRAPTRHRGFARLEPRHEGIGHVVYVGATGAERALERGDRGKYFAVPVAGEHPHQLCDFVGVDLLLRRGVGAAWQLTHSQPRARQIEITVCRLQPAEQSTSTAGRRPQLK